jgi:putative nucleotidyltransferase with HDIG domain
MPKRILFVDDEPSIRGIYEMLQPFLGEDYTVTTASGGEEALALFSETQFDLVVSDLTMPKMTGIQLLSEISKNNPGTARIVVSGFADEVTAAKCLMVAHRYFTKPFNPTSLSEVIVSLCDARTFAANDRIRDYVGRIDAIPTLSKTYLELTKALRSQSVPLRDISSIIEQDLALTAKVLQTVNSVRFAPSRRIQSVFDAVQMIGFEVVRALVLGIQVFEFSHKTSKTELFQTVWSHSLRTAVRAKRLAAYEDLPYESQDETFLIGLLHDIGKVVLGASCPEEYQKLWVTHRDDSAALVEAESQSFGADHAHVGAFLLRLWGLPEEIAQAVQMHHSIGAVELTEFNPQLALHIAQELAPGRQQASLALDAIGHLGLEGHLPMWENIVHRDSDYVAAAVED